MPKDKMSRLLKMNHPNVVTIQSDDNKFPIPPEIPKQIFNEMQSKKVEYEVWNPIDKTEFLLVENNKLLQEQTDEINNLKKQLEYANIQLTQANERVTFQNIYIEELKSNLKSESEQRIIAENKLSKKDWKLALVAFVTAMVILGIEHWNDIYSFILNQVLQR